MAICRATRPRSRDAATSSDSWCALHPLVGSRQAELSTLARSPAAAASSQLGPEPSDRGRSLPLPLVDRRELGLGLGSRGVEAGEVGDHLVHPGGPGEQRADAGRGVGALAHQLGQLAAA